MSGWDNRGDIEDWERRATLDYEAWARDVEREAAALQKTNKWARWMYFVPALGLLLVGIIVGNGFPIAISAFFWLLFIWNELLIRKLRKAGIK